MGATERGNTADKIAKMLMKRYERPTERRCILVLAKKLVEYYEKKKNGRNIRRKGKAGKAKTKA